MGKGPFRRTRSGLLGVALLLLLAACGAARAQGLTQMLVVDVSNSMREAIAAEYPAHGRMTEARAAIDRIVRDLGALLPAGTPHRFGVATFGSGQPNRCDSYGVAVPPRPFDPLLAEHIRAEIARRPPRGQTPIVEGIVSAAEALPQHGGRLVVITDLDRLGQCASPCDTLDALRRIGKPHPEVAEVMFLVTVGVQSRDAAIIRGFAECLGPRTRLRHIAQPGDADRIGAEIAAELGRALAPPGVRVNVSFGRVPFVTDLRALGFQANAEWSIRGQASARIQPPSQVVITLDGVVDSYDRLTATLRPPGQLRSPGSPDSSCPGHAAEASGRPIPILEEVQADVLRARGDVPFERELPPSVLCIDESGAATAEWTIRELTGGAQSARLTGERVSLPPGRYQVSVRAGNRAIEAQDVTLGYGSSVMLRLREAPPPPRPPAQGSLFVRVWSFPGDGAEAAPHDGRLRQPSAQDVGRSGSRLEVAEGEVEVALRPRDAKDETAVRVRVAAGPVTEVHAYTAPSRLVLTLSGLGEEDAKWAQWWVGQPTGPAHCSGPVCDLALPAGKHSILVVVGGRSECRQRTEYQLDPRSVLSAMMRLPGGSACDGNARP
jgi:hypothetical protein